jgi:hypothetical protein
MSGRTVRRSSWERLPVLIALAAFAAPLLAHGLIGTTMRYSGDDYCYAGLFRQRGLLGMLSTTYTSPAPFAGNRFSLTTASGLADAIGPLASAVLPGLVLVCWVGGLMFLLTQMRRFQAHKLSGAETGLLAAVLAYASLAATPDPIQSLYWRSAMLPYLAPTVLLVFILGLMVRYATALRVSPVALIAIFLLSLFAAGLSETAASVQLVTLGVLTLAALLTRTELRPRAPAAIGLLTTGLIGSLIAMAMLFLAPTNWALPHNLPRATELARVLSMAVRNGYLFAYRSVFRQFAPSLVAFLVALILARRGPRTSALLRPTSLTRMLTLVLAIGSAVALLILASMLPAAYTRSSYPPGRVLIVATFATICAAAALGWMVGCWSSAITRRSVWLSSVVTGLVLSSLSVFPVLAAVDTLEQYPSYLRWVRVWDERDREIRTARGLGNSSVDVMLMDKIIPDVAELQPDPDYWYNNCAEWYYDLDRLSASLPGWDS